MKETDPTVNLLLTKTRVTLLGSPDGSEAKKLAETNKVIDAFLKDKLSTIDPTATLSKDGAAKVSAVFQTIADTLKALP
jgi:hypothetical protein